MFVSEEMFRWFEAAPVIALGFGIVITWLVYTSLEKPRPEPERDHKCPLGS